MQRPTPTSEAPTSRRGSTESMSSPAGFPVLPFPKPANGKELPTTATCGPKCIEQFSKSDHAGSWQKTFSALLIGTKGWFSNRCTLTWKLRDTPYNRSYFQLAASTHRTSGTEHGLLPTVTTTNSAQGFHSKNGAGQPLLPMAALLQTPTRTAIESRGLAALLKRKEMKNKSGRVTIPPGNLSEQIYSVMNGGTLTDMSATLQGPDRGLLPTPVAFDQKTCHQKVTGKTITRESGETFTAGLRMLAPNDLLPTPTARCHNSGTTKERKDGISRLSELNHLVARSAGKGSQLSPLFCEEMMGFPKYYTVYPFLVGEENQ